MRPELNLKEGLRMSPGPGSEQSLRAVGEERDGWGDRDGYIYAHDGETAAIYDRRTFCNEGLTQVES